MQKHEKIQTTAMDTSRKANLSYILIITIIGAIITYYILYQAKQVSNSIERVSVEQLPPNRQYATSTGKLGELSFIYDSRLTKNVATSTFMDFDSELNHVVLSSSGYRTIDNYFPIKVYYNKGGNPQQLSAADYFKTHGPLNDKNAPPADSAQYIKINNIDAYKVVFHTSSLYFRSYYYDFIIYYITKGTDEYEIWGYQLPENISSDLSVQDISDGKSYQQIFSDFVDSIHF